MTTTAGDTALQIVIKPGSTERELKQIEAVIDRINQAKDKQTKDVQELERRSQDQTKKVQQGVDRVKGTQPGFGDRAKRLIDTFLGPVQTAADVAESVLPKLGQTLKSGAEGTVFEGPAKILNERIQALADEVTNVRATLDSIRPTAAKAVEFNIAALRLGGKFPEDQDELIKQIWKIQNAQETMSRNLRRDINNQTIDFIINGAKAAAGGGK